MAKRVQRRRGTTAEHATFTGYVGESTVDTTKDTVVVHDGVVAGGFPLAREDLSNVTLTNLIGVTELKLTDGTPDQVIKTNGSGTISFGTIDISGAAVGGDISGTVGNAQIVANAVGITEIAVTDGTNGQALITNGSGTLSFGDVLTDPALGGHLSGTTSNAAINNNTITSGMLTTALKNFTVDEFVGASAQTTFTLTAAVGSVNALIAYIDGIVQPPTAYSLPTTTSIQFIVAPPVSSVIRCVHLGFQSTVGVPSDGTITTAKIAANAVTSTKILDGTIATADMADDAITEAKIAAQTITNASITPTTIRNQELANLTITGAKIGANQIDGTKIALGADTQGDIMYYDGTNWVRLGPSTSGHVLTTAAANANPYWAAGSSGTALPGVGSAGNVLTSDGSNWASAVVPVATTTVSGSVEIATQAEVTTGTDTARSITPATLAGRLTAGVKQGDLKTTTQDNAQQRTVHSNFIHSGGEYVLGRQYKATSQLVGFVAVFTDEDFVWHDPNNMGKTPAEYQHHAAAGWPSASPVYTGYPITTTFSTARTIFHYDCVTAGGPIVTARSRYIQASPPYDIGDGHIHTFIYLVIENGTGKILESLHAADPTWANNGPTDIRPEYEKDGKLYKHIKRFDKTKKYSDPDCITNTLEEITLDYKNSDMDLLPHPYIGRTDMEGKSVVLIDPCSDIALKIEELKEVGETPLMDLLVENDYVRFGNEHIKGRCTPCTHGINEVMVVKPTWKNSK